MTTERGRVAAARREQAARRADELRELRARLEAGAEVTAEDLELARSRLDEAADHAQEALHRAARAHARAAAAHRAAAAMADSVGDDEGARRHRDDAGRDDAQALEDDAVAGVDAPGVDPSSRDTGMGSGESTGGG